MNIIFAKGTFVDYVPAALPISDGARTRACEVVVAVVVLQTVCDSPQDMSSPLLPTKFGAVAVGCAVRPRYRWRYVANHPYWWDADSKSGNGMSIKIEQGSFVKE